MSFKRLEIVPLTDFPVILTLLPLHYDFPTWFRTYSHQKELISFQMPILLLYLYLFFDVIILLLSFYLLITDLSFCLHMYKSFSKSA